jgi:hypothetical protein
MRGEERRGEERRGEEREEKRREIDHEGVFIPVRRESQRYGCE